MVFLTGHFSTFGGCFVILPCEVKDAVDDDAMEFLSEGNGEERGVGADGRHGDEDVAREE